MNNSVIDIIQVNIDPFSGDPDIIEKATENFCVKIMDIISKKLLCLPMISLNFIKKQRLLLVCKKRNK